ncbi:hypothetical protein MGG_17498 [Pyricularia oryzae 70-15]|uniref:Uncharacterized protein n=1 Tax=Pyricularia oryzae (strain 70-15 / ATCC MYA-4617 / FGSC 8958) TaxID=242507 RepID=G4NDK8_PYRO7|nr:uncharacterized protein MGG_17498 [Pyricularia oryzae 70-15]EHA49293.1 hypothetical protein MGG_17498 [Pyricularia oryzae 70-15]
MGGLTTAAAPSSKLATKPTIAAQVLFTLTQLWFSQHSFFGNLAAPAIEHQQNAAYG